MKKTWLSYPLWLVYAIFTAMSAAAYFSWLSIYVWGIGQNQAVLCICLMFCVIAGIWFAGHGLMRCLERRPARVRRPGERTAGRYPAMALEALLVLSLCVAAVFCRLYLLSRFDGEITGGIFYDMALVRADGKAPWTVQGVSYLGALYTSFLSFVLSFTGNKAAAGVMLQLVLQTAAIFIFYFAGKLLSGRGEAMCALGIMAFAPGLCKGILSLTPETLYFLLYAAGLLLCGLYGEKACRAGRTEGEAVSRKKGYALAVICGLYIGCVSFLDMAGWTLLIPAAFACRKQRETDAKNEKSGMGIRKKQKKAAGAWGQWAVCVLMSLAAVCLFLGIHASAAGDSYEKILSAWLEYPVRQISFSAEDFFWKIGAEPFSWMGLLICLCGTFNVIGFWPGKTQKQDCWILLLLFFPAFQIFHFGGIDYGIFLTAAEGILAGIGICSMGNQGRNLNPEEKYNTADESFGAEGEMYGMAGGSFRAEEGVSGMAGGSFRMEEGVSGMAGESFGAEKEMYGAADKSFGEREDMYGTADKSFVAEGGMYGTSSESFRAEEGMHRAADGNFSMEEEMYSMTDKKVQMEKEKYAVAEKKAQTEGKYKAADEKPWPEGTYGAVDEEAWTEKTYGMADERAWKKETYGTADEKARTEGKAAVPDEVREEPQKEEPKVKLLDNPLPLPKKHVKRVMAYAKDVEGDELEFDFSVKEDDDFDI